MDVSSRQIVGLAAPVVVAYLSWSAVSGAPSPTLQQEVGSASSIAAASKRPVIPILTRDVFSQEGYGVTGGGARGPDGPPGSSNSVQLNGTVVAGKWRMAIINGTRVFEGQNFRGLLVQAVGRDSVTLVNEAGQPLVLSLDIAEPPPLATLTKPKPGALTKSADGDQREKREVSPQSHDVKTESKTFMRSSSTILRSTQPQQRGDR